MNLPGSFYYLLKPVKICITVLILHELVAIASGLKWL